MQWGPQPYEGILSEVCSAFGCPPDVAGRQDWALVQAILDYRQAREAIALFNRGRSGVEEMGRRPEMQEMLLRLVKAQEGEGATLEHAMAKMEAQAEEENRDG